MPPVRAPHQDGALRMHSLIVKNQATPAVSVFPAGLTSVLAAARPGQPEALGCRVTTSSWQGADRDHEGDPQRREADASREPARNRDLGLAGWLHRPVRSHADP